MNCYSGCLTTTVITTTTQAPNQVCVGECDEDCELSHADPAAKYTCIVNCYDICLSTTSPTTTIKITTTTSVATTTTISELQTCYNKCNNGCDSEENEIDQHQCVINCYSACLIIPTTTAITTTTVATTTTLDAHSVCNAECDSDCDGESDYSVRFQCLLDCYIDCVPTTIAPTTLDPVLVCQSQGY